jgi:hypothetical protein
MEDPELATTEPTIEMYVPIGKALEIANPEPSQLNPDELVDCFRAER